MDIEEIKTLTGLMIENDLTEIQITDGEKRIVLRRGVAAASQPSFQSAPASTAGPAIPPAVVEQQAIAATTPPAAEAELMTIKSPMVGTFYSSADPDSPPFAQVGDQVNPDSVVCIIEAMKVFNEIKAEVSGIIESIKITNGQPVEFGQVIMTLRPV